MGEAVAAGVGAVGRDWRKALGPVPLEELQDPVLGAAWREHQGGAAPVP